MKVVCFVPSWTETLLWAGVDVVGRTRFCIHPNEKTKNIPVVGGTKDADWETIDALQPDLILFDREENTLAMVQGCQHAWHATHVRSVDDMARELQDLSQKLNAPKLLELAKRWGKVLHNFSASNEIPGFIQWQREIPNFSYERVMYVIWARPWMEATQATFIGSICKLLGWTISPSTGPVLYPEFYPKNHTTTLFLCSSEPYPFQKKPEVMAELPGAIALVDGEKLSWFGLRTLLYLESLKSPST